MIYVLISFILGLGALGFPLIYLMKERTDKKGNFLDQYVSIISFSLCFLSIYIQILLMKSYGEEWTAVIDAL